jgi:hypothetical protein
VNHLDPDTGTLESRSKAWWQSKTIIGALSAIAATVIGFVFKANVPQEDLFEFFMGLASVIAMGFAIYGRITAKTEIRKAERATPEEIARARRGGSFKGGVLVRVLVVIVFTLLTLGLAFVTSGCSVVDTPRGKRYSGVVSAGIPIERTGHSIVRFGTGCAIVSGATVVFLPVGFILGIPAYVIGGPTWELGSWMTGNHPNWTYGGL